MAKTFRAPATDYQGLKDFLGYRRIRKIGNNTYLEQVHRDDPSLLQGIAVRLHDTQILVFWEDGTIKLDSGGWKTPTTKHRLNGCLPYPFGVTQEKGHWYIDQYYYATNGEGRCRIRAGEFSDGMTIDTRVSK